jgi:hypothetical protein
MLPPATATGQSRSRGKPLEEAPAFSSLMKLNVWNGKRVAGALRMPASKVSRTLALLDLPDDIQQPVDDRGISARNAHVTIMKNCKSLRDPLDK